MCKYTAKGNILTSFAVGASNQGNTDRLDIAHLCGICYQLCADGSVDGTRQNRAMVEEMGQELHNTKDSTEYMATKNSAGGPLHMS